MWELSLKLQVLFIYSFILLLLAVAILLVVLWFYNNWRSKPTEDGDKGAAEDEN